MSNFNFTLIQETIETKLVKNSQNVLRIMEEWKKIYENENILSISSNFSEYYSIDDFCDKQKTQISKFRNKILNKWIPVLSEIYKIEISELNKNM